nr:MAG TPA: hypothetical protein [Caudoviricetes sp.]
MYFILYIIKESSVDHYPLFVYSFVKNYYYGYHMFVD